MTRKYFCPETISKMQNRTETRNNFLSSAKLVATIAAMIRKFLFYLINMRRQYRYYHPWFYRKTKLFSSPDFICFRYIFESFWKNIEK